MTAEGTVKKWQLLVCFVTNFTNLKMLGQRGNSFETVLARVNYGRIFKFWRFLFELKWVLHSDKGNPRNCSQINSKRYHISRRLINPEMEVVILKNFSGSLVKIRTTTLPFWTQKIVDILIPIKK
jgi:hypothetical protein